jgi:adenine-specific DNA-methyltransferase
MVELIWDGKYKDGKRVQPVRVALPFQTIETVNESAQERQKMLDFFSSGRDSDWRNRLIWGDKKYVLPSLLEEFAGRVNLIYIDPPFATGSDFSFTASVPDDPDEDGEQGATFVKQPSILEQKAYRDTWGRGLDSFLQWFYETAFLLRELLAENGSIYVHLDWRTSSYARVILDEVFGSQSFKSEIIWQRTYTSGSSKSIAKKFSANTDSVFFYTKSEAFIFTSQYKPYSEATIRRYDKIEPDGRRYKWENLSTYSEKTLNDLLEKGLARFNPQSKNPVYKKYLDEDRGTPIDNLWTDIQYLGTFSPERVDYPTQKPEALLERIIKASSNEGDIVLDCFCGSGTTAAVAERLGRRWITCDLGRFAIHTARKRFLGIPNVKPFVVQNLGKYERQAWQTAEWETLETARARESAYRHFILELYHATPVTSGVYLHGLKSGRMVHVGSVDAPVTMSDVKAIARELLARIGTGAEAPSTAGVDILGWDFAFELNELGKNVAKDAGVHVRFIPIPREVLEKKAVEQGDIRFYELAALSLKHKLEKRRLTLELTDFIVAPDDVPQDIMNAITNWSQWVDYWAVDFNYRGDTFHNEWQAYRTRKNPRLETRTIHTFDAPGEYTVLVKVIDLLGNDTTKSFTLEVR